ncbi:hypothetical protein M011DRAFT_466981 [Sporormia fimetaria CBS 119925]|uniref:Uncharacterized protein n=1 Tax=Sporormia fimetaria CBS 119925 TaxID=1340428 RepID=A0A6A6VBF5_9PLEO|nr:hypothetical protein M011DRAFT_466981 [Sporormia fimetaria CBS 119925]
MSWMDSWSRPSKHAVTPPPLYLTAAGDDVPYCHSCGRVIGSRKTQATQKHQQSVKYCSSRCKHSKPGPVDRRIEATFLALLNGQTPPGLAGDDDSNTNTSATQAEPNPTSHQPHTSKSKKKKAKGDNRITVDCATVEALVFAREKDPEKVYGRKKNRAARGVRDEDEDEMCHRGYSEADNQNTDPMTKGRTSGEQKDEDDADSGVDLDPTALAGHATEDGKIHHSAGKIRPPQSKSDVNGSIGGEKGWAERGEETEEMKAKRMDGQRKAEEREMVRRAARRGCAFGFVGEDGERRKCEAVMKGVAVEASFAKGEWGVRFREEGV